MYEKNKRARMEKKRTKEQLKFPEGKLEEG